MIINCFPFDVKYGVKIIQAVVCVAKYNKCVDGNSFAVSCQETLSIFLTNWQCLVANVNLRFLKGSDF